MDMKEIVAALEYARDNCQYGFVEVTIPGQTDTEMIINHSSSLNNKIAYYQKAYGEDGVHRMNDRIRIIRAGGVECLTVNHTVPARAN